MMLPSFTHINPFASLLAHFQGVDLGKSSGHYVTFTSTKNPVLLIAETGVPYLWKPERNPTVRSAEEGASMLACFITGGQVPIAVRKTYREQDGLIQEYIPHEISEPFDVKKLNDEQIGQLLAHMISDWVISNYDNHSRNYLVDNHGNVIGIDKGWSFKFFRGAAVYSSFANEFAEPATIYPAAHINNTWPPYYPDTYPVYFALFNELVSRKNIGPVLRSQPVIDALSRCEALTSELIDLWLGDYAKLAFPNNAPVFLNDVLLRATPIREHWELFCNKVDALRYS